MLPLHNLSSVINFKKNDAITRFQVPFNDKKKKKKQEVADILFVSEFELN